MSLRVIQVSTDDITGGAARCAFRLHRGLVGEGVQSRMLVRRKKGHDPLVDVFAPDADPIRRAARKFRRRRLGRAIAAYGATRPPGYEGFNTDRTEWGSEPAAQLTEFDVLNLHWVSRFIDARGFLNAIPPDVPIVWTLHDMNLFTGGCHYDDGCGAFRDQCGRCPQLGSEDENDLSHQVWSRKEELFGGDLEGRMHIVTPSRWMATEAAGSSLLGDRFPISVIPYGLDTDAFAPRDRGEARHVLGVPPDAVVVLFVAQMVGNRRKGFGHLVDALGELSDVDNLFLLSIGSGNPPADGFQGRHLSFTSEDRMLSLVYSAADLFVLPSVQDNLPATVLESIACGTPVVAFDAGGVGDMVREGRTGFLAPVGDVAALAQALRRALSDRDALSALRDSCREVAVTEYPLSLQAARYTALYEELAR